MSPFATTVAGLSCLALGFVLAAKARPRPDGTYPPYLRPGWVKACYPLFLVCLLGFGVAITIWGANLYFASGG